jgi:hypothetical protein
MEQTCPWRTVISPKFLSKMLSGVTSSEINEIQVEGNCDRHEPVARMQQCYIALKTAGWNYCVPQAIGPMVKPSMYSALG